MNNLWNRSVGPFDEAAAQRHGHMGLLDCNGDVNADPAASGSYKQLRFSKGGHGVKKLIYRISAAIVVAGIIIMKRRTQRT